MYGPRIPGERITLAPPSERYIDDYLRWFADPVVTRYLKVRHPPSRAQEEAFLTHKAAVPDSILWAILLGERLIGSLGIEGVDWHNRHARTGTVIGERDCWGHGCATEAMRLCTRYAFDALGLESLNTLVYGPNEGSRRALLQAGASRSGLAATLHVHRGGVPRRVAGADSARRLAGTGGPSAHLTGEIQRCAITACSAHRRCAGCPLKRVHSVRLRNCGPRTCSHAERRANHVHVCQSRPASGGGRRARRILSRARWRRSGRAGGRLARWAARERASSTREST